MTDESGYGSVSQIDSGGFKRGFSQSHRNRFDQGKCDGADYRVSGCEHNIERRDARPGTVKMEIPSGTKGRVIGKDA